MIVSRLEAAGPGHPLASPGEWLDAATVVVAVRKRARELRGSLRPGQAVGVAGGEAGWQLIQLLAALEAGHEVLACNGGWWPRERDAVLERLRPGWLLEADGHLRPLPTEPTEPTDHTEPTRSSPTNPARPALGDGGEIGSPRLWLGTAASFGEPMPFGWDKEQLDRFWLMPDPDISPGQTVVISGDVGHAPSLRFALGALFAGAAVRFVDRKALLATLGVVGAVGAVDGTPIDHLCTTPPLLRRALHQLHRRQRPVAVVGRTVLHQGSWRPHEHDGWPTLLSGLVQARVSATEAAGWVLHGEQPAPGVTLRIAPQEPGRTGDPTTGERPSEGSLFISGPVTATTGPAGIRPGPGWDSGDLAERDGSGAVRWQRRRRDHFEVDGLAVDPLEVEAALGSHPLVAEVVIAPRPHPERGNVVVAVVVPANPEWPPFVEDLAEVSAALGAHCRVEALAIVDDVPLNAAGAVHRRLVNYEEAGR
ncbi:MAG: AMP-binding enzyme [Acidimicrobiales bacterium]